MPALNAARACCAAAPWAALALCLAAPAGAQITLDGSLGSAGALGGPNFSIGANLGQQLGGNLFHSFSQFNVLSGQSATFSGPATVSNIISRVTGSSASTIDGLLRSTISGANLYLLNPRGVMFGPNASLDVSGSFHVSTANYLSLGTSGRFDASNPGASILSLAPPSAFGFLGPTPAPIALNGSLLEVPAGKTLSLIGGDLTLTNAALVAPSGRIELASVRSAGEVTPVAAGISSTGVSAFGNINAASTQLDAGSFVPQPAGAIHIVGGNLTLGNSAVRSHNASLSSGAGIDIRLSGSMLLDRSIVAAHNFFFGTSGDINISAAAIRLTQGGFISSATFASGDGGRVSVTAGSLTIHGGNSPGASSGGIYASSEQQATGNAGALTVSAGSIEVLEGGSISASTFGAGRGGAMNVTATGSLRIAGANALGRISTISADSASSGAGGDSGTVTIAADSIRVEDGGRIEAFTSGQGNAGGIQLRARDISLTDGGRVNSTTSGSGRGGDVVVDAGGGRLRIAGSGPDGIVSGVFAGSSAGSAGNAGNISVLADALSLESGGAISGATFGQGRGADVVVAVTGSLDISGSSPGSVSGIFASATAGSAGSAGSVLIGADTIRISEGIVTADTAGSGNAGSVAVSARDISLSNGASIDSSTFGAGRGGNVSVRVDGALSIGGADGTGRGSGIFGLSESAATGDAGSVQVIAGSIRIGERGSISAETNGGGNAGSVAVSAGGITLSNGAAIGSSTFGAGRGGNVNVTVAGQLSIAGRDADGFASGVFASSETDSSGDAGSVTVTAGSIAIGAGGGISASTFGSGDGGSILIAANNITLHGGRIATVSKGTGLAGSIAINAADSLQLLARGTISTEALSSDGGNIAIQAKTLVYLQDSQISTSVGTGQGNGGNIFIDPTFVVLDNGQIIANAHGGNGGNIDIVSEFFLATPESLVQASSALGVQGTVTVTAPNVNLGAGLVALPGSFFDAASQMRASCSARAARGSNSFTGAARGGLPAGPERSSFGAYSDGVGGESNLAASVVHLACLR